jgi:hypothetical protein
MTFKIFKYNLEVVDKQTIKLPPGSRVLSVMNQRDNIVLYALVHPINNKNLIEDVSIRIVGTGHDIDFFIPNPNLTDGYKFLGTVSLHDGALMFHVFYMVGE